jgi:hypothetical protein
MQESEPGTDVTFRAANYPPAELDRLPQVAGGDTRRIAAVAHHQLLADSDGASTAAAALDLLASNLATTYNGLDDTDQPVLAAEWRMLLADLLAAPDHIRAVWLTTHREAVTGWLPTQVGWRTKAVANIVVRGPAVERFHATGSPKTTFLDNQLGTSVLLWAAAQLLDRYPLTSPQAAGLGPDDLEAASTFEHRLPAAADQDGWRILQTVADAATAANRTATFEASTLGEDSSHVGAGEADLVRDELNAWDPIPYNRLDDLIKNTLLAVPSIVSLNRSPVHLANSVGRLVAAGTSLVTPNVFIDARGTVQVRRSYLPPTDKRELGPDTFATLPAAGLSRAHQRALGIPLSGNQRPGRNDPCPCGSGRKYKRCCA